MNPKARGERAEAMILAAIVERGFSISIPFGNNQRYDLIWDDGRRLHRIQCKSGWIAKGCLVFATASKNGFTGVRKAYDGQIEFFMVYANEIGKIYKVPAQEAPRAFMSLRIDKPRKQGNRKGLRWAKDFEF